MAGTCAPEPDCLLAERRHLRDQAADGPAMIARSLSTGLSCAWALTSVLCSSDYQLRRRLEERRQPYVLAVRSNPTLRFLAAG